MKMFKLCVITVLMVSGLDIQSMESSTKSSLEFNDLVLKDLENQNVSAVRDLLDQYDSIDNNSADSAAGPSFSRDSNQGIFGKEKTNNIVSGDVRNVQDQFQGKCVFCKSPMKLGQERLISLVMSNNIEELARELNFGLDPNVITCTGVTPLMLASRQGSLSALQLLLAAGARVDPKNKKGETASTLAKNQDIKRWLSRYQARLNGY